jgi:hypothetical protein
MDEMTAFEHQVAGELVRRAGPERPVDAAAILTAITATRSPNWRFQSVFSAAGFVVAAAIVALFGGFLLAGVMTEPSAESVPALAPSPATTPDLLRATPDPSAGLVTEPVAPGIVRVLSDGAGHDLASLGVDDIAIGADGAVWMTGTSSLFRLGQPGVAPVRGYSSYRNLTVADDGTVWVGTSNPSSYDGERWSSAPGDVDWWAVRPDGTVWGVRPDASFFGGDEQKPPGFVLSRIEDGRWATVDVVGWPRGAIGDASAPYGPGLVATADGSLWLIAHRGDKALLMRYDGTTWDAVETPFDPWWIADGPDGSWVLVDRNVGTHDGETRIARFVQGTWSESRVQLPDATEYWSEDTLRPIVASDGAVWLRVGLPDERGGRQHVFPEGCDGVARVVGSTWTHYLAGICIWDMAPGPHGEVWVATWDGDMQLQQAGDVYLIRPAVSDS